MRGFRIVPHTSEVGLEAGGRGLPELFRNAAAGLLHLYGLPRPAPGARRTSKTLRLGSTDLDDLLVCWLNEIVFLVQNRGFVPTKISLASLSTEGLRATLSGWGAKALPLQVEVKSATRHGLSVKKTREGWRAAVILDV